MIVSLDWGVHKRCPFKDEDDWGQLHIAIPGVAPELHKLAEDVAALTVNPISHEDFTREVRALLPEGSWVVTNWETGPWRVEVRVD